MNGQKICFPHFITVDGKYIVVNFLKFIIVI